MERNFFFFILIGKSFSTNYTWVIKMTPYKKIVTYAGEPVQEYGQLLKSIGEDFDRKKAAHQTFDFLRKSVDVAENDKAIINPILDGFDNTIKDDEI